MKTDTGTGGGAPAPTAFNLSPRAQWLLLGAAVLLFLLACPAEPLFFKNQVTKYLVGMADADVGYLREDWTANTRNGLPAFRGVVFLIYWLGLPKLSYVFWAMLTSILVVGAFGLGRSLAGQKTLADCLRVDRFSCIFLTLLILTNVGVLTKLWWGVAQQYMLSPVLEPSHVATLYPLAILLYVTERRSAAFLCTLPIGLFHPGYIIPVAVLLAAFVFAEGRNLRRMTPVYWATLALALVALAGHALYLDIHFSPTSPEMEDRANIILTEYRIPQHALVSHWLFSPGAMARIATVLVAAWLARKHLIGRMLIIAFVGIAALTSLQLLTGSHLIALIAPWRTSVWVVPLSVIVILSAIAQFLDRFADNPRWAPQLRLPLLIALALLSVVAGLGGANAKLQDFAVSIPGYEAYLKKTANAQTQILAPTTLLKIRVDTQAPVYVTEKSHPYQDFEVLEWYRRVQIVDALYKPAVIDCGALEKLAREARLTEMVVTQFDQTVNCPFTKLVYLDAEARIFVLNLK